MRRALLSLLLLTGLCLGLSTTTLARDCNNGNRSINGRQRNQSQRIVGGVRSGELTRRELGRLRTEQCEIRVEGREAGSDGEFTVAEGRDIRQELNDASRHIYRARHNRRDRN